MDHRDELTELEKQHHGYWGICRAPRGDAALAAYLAAGSITDPTEVAAVTELFSDLRSTGIFPKLIYLFLCSPTSLSAALVNAKTAVSATNVGATHSSSGLAVGGSNYIYATEYSFALLPAYSFHCSMYSTAPNPSSGNGGMGYIGQNSTYNAGFSVAGANITGRYGNSGSGDTLSAIANYSGRKYFLFNVDSQTSATLVLDNSSTTTGTAITTDLSGIVVSGNKYGIGTYYTGSTIAESAATNTLKTVTIGESLTSQQKTDLYNIILAYNTALGRN